MTRYLGLAEFFWLAEQVTGLDTTTLVKASRVELADSALHAPQAGFGDEDFYPDIYDKAAVLACRLAWNHPLPDGNKRARGRACCCSSISTSVGRDMTSICPARGRRRRLGRRHADTIALWPADGRATRSSVV